MRLRPGLTVLWRARDEVQIGTDPRWAVRIGGLTQAQVSALTSLPDGAGLPDLDRLGGAGVEPGASGEPDASHGSPAARPSGAGGSVLGALRDARLVLDAPARRTAPATAPLPSGAATDAATWALLLDDGDGARLVRARGDRVVGFLGAGRLALTAACVLASAGVGTVLLEDAAAVTTADLGVGGYTARDVGSTRAAAAARVLRDLAPEVRTTGPAGVRPDVVVTVEHDVADAARARTLMAAEVVHLSVVVREADVLVGPLVRPGGSPCLRCLDLHRADEDPRWPVVATQLATRRGRRTGEESVLAAVSGSLTAAQVLAHLDGRTPLTVGGSIDVALPDAVPRVRRWAVHPGCGCTDLPEAVLHTTPAGRRDPLRGR